MSNLTFYLLQQDKERKSNEWGSGFRARKQRDNEDLEITAEITVYYHTIVIYCWYLKLSHAVIPIMSYFFYSTHYSLRQTLHAAAASPSLARRSVYQAFLRVCYHKSCCLGSCIAGISALESDTSTLLNSPLKCFQLVLGFHNKPASF